VRAQCPTARVYEMPAGCNLQQPVILRATLADGPRLCFIGSLDYTANVDGLEWFIDAVWPVVLRRLPGATLTVAGKSATTMKFLRGAAGVRYVGYVADVASVTNAADIAVVPLRIGGGMRVKVLDFLSRGLPIVTTAVGSEGIPRIYGGREVYRVADTPTEFANQLVDLSASLVSRQQLADAGRELIAEKYSWQGLVDGFCKWVEGSVVVPGQPVP
jgi:glycosyltransferase involved in cell wall biosynthesis